MGPNLPISDQAEAMSTIDYELLTRLGRRFPRNWVERRMTSSAPVAAAKAPRANPFQLIGRTVLAALREIGRISVILGPRPCSPA